MNIQRVARHEFEMYLAKYISKPEIVRLLSEITVTEHTKAPNFVWHFLGPTYQCYKNNFMRCYAFLSDEFLFT